MRGKAFAMFVVGLWLLTAPFSSASTAPDVRVNRASAVTGSHALAQDAPRDSASPLDVVPLVRLGFPDTTLRGRRVSTEIFVPGPGEFVPGEENWLDLDYVASELLATDSVMTVVWNGLPIDDRSLGGAAGRQRVSIRVPKDRIDPDVNRLQILATLRLALGGCIEDDNPGRHLTVLNTTQVRYAFVDREPRPQPVRPDLARYPEPFYQANAAQPPPVLFVLPDQPSSSELTALVRVAAQLGQLAGGRGIRLQVAQEGQLPSASELSRAHLVFVGRLSNLPTLSRLSVPIGLQRDAAGQYLDANGQVIGSGVGLLFEAASPWNPGRMALAVTGQDDPALERAALAVASRAGIRALRGSFALIPEATPARDAPTGNQLLQLADLGRADETVTGIGDHALTFSVDGLGQAGRASVPFNLVVSHSPLLDRARSSVRVTLNGVPLGASSFQALAPSRGALRLTLPAASLRPGANTLGVQFSLALARTEDQLCAPVPAEQAWAVLHADSAFETGAAVANGPTGEVTLAHYPYPFVRKGGLGELLMVVPTSLDTTLEPLVRLAADLGRASRADVLMPRAVRADEFALDSALATEYDVVLMGLAPQVPLLAQLGGRLPVQVNPNERRLDLSRELTLAVRDSTELGVIQSVGSPWSATRQLLVVTATSANGLPLAVEALRQGNLTGTVALVSRREPLPEMPGRTPTPERLAVGGPLPEPLQVSTFSLRPRIEPPGNESGRRLPYLLAVALVAVAAALFMAGTLVYGAFDVGRRRGPRGR